jgi:hypothetical protein
MRKPARDGSIGVNYDNYRMGDVVAIAAGRIALVHQTKSANDLGLGVGENRVLYFPAFGEAR